MAADTGASLPALVRRFLARGLQDGRAPRRFPLVGPAGADRVDEFMGGARRGGELRVSLLGVPLQRLRGPETTTGIRPYPSGKDFVPRPWGGDFGDCAGLGSTRVPNRRRGVVGRARKTGLSTGAAGLTRSASVLLRNAAHG
jgi:hypothetical protein